MVGFASERFIGSETLGFIEVVVELNGTSNTPIAVTVSPVTQSSSATGGVFTNKQYTVAVSTSGCY